MTWRPSTAGRCGLSIQAETGNFSGRAPRRQGSVLPRQSVLRTRIGDSLACVRQRLQQGAPRLDFRQRGNSDSKATFGFRNKLNRIDEPIEQGRSPLQSNLWFKSRAFSDNGQGGAAIVARPRSTGCVAHFRPHIRSKFAPLGRGRRTHGRHSQQLRRHQIAESVLAGLRAADRQGLQCRSAPSGRAGAAWCGRRSARKARRSSTSTARAMARSGAADGRLLGLNNIELITDRDLQRQSAGDQAGQARLAGPRRWSYR